MDKVMVFFVVSILFISCKTYQASSDDLPKYEIIRISLKNNIYEIHAKEGVTYYKILSLKETNKNVFCKKIKIGRKYKLNLVSLDVPLYVDGIDFNGEPILIEKDSIFDLHSATNLFGIYLCK